MKLIILLSTLLMAGLVFNPEKKHRSTPDPYKERMAIFCAPSFDPQKMNEGNAPLFKGLGNLNYKITTTSSTAQKYFNQGLTLVYAFNHGEAGRSFKAAIKLDSTAAMAYWGMGMVLGPNYNAGLKAEVLSEIHDVMNKAVKYSAKVSEREKALINALVKRFPKEPVTDMTEYNAAYAAAMKQAYERFPNDAEIGCIYADALMNEHPWNIWLKDGTPQPWTPLIMSVLEKLLKQFPQHVGVNHMYIHAIEASRQASKGLVAANRLEGMLPAAGHLLHMPSHIYIRTGHYHKGVLVNEEASLADSNYIAQCKVQGSYPLMLYPHNVHFLAACAFLEGNSKKAIESSWRVSGIADRRYLAENATLQHYYSIPYYVMVHLGKWDDLLQLPEPGSSLQYPLAVWRYARGMSYAAKGNISDAQKELDALKVIGARESLKSMLIWETNSAYDLVQIADKILSAEIAKAKKQFDVSITLLNEAVELESKLTYQEPPDWFFSVRHSLGHVLVKAGKFAEAEKVYKEDLVNLPDNGWSLMGLYNSLQGQNKIKEAAEVKKRFDEAWKYADIKITSSRVD